MNNIIIIGAGNMGLALGKGFLRNQDVKVYFKTTANAPSDTGNFQDDILENKVFFHSQSDFFYSIQNPWIILAVKPYHIVSVIRDIADIISHTNPKALVSVAAGIDTTMISSVCPLHIPIIRTMPNISVAYGNGIIGYFSHNNTIKQEFHTLSKPLGMLYELKDEQEFHLFTALAGSGPAFLCHTIEAMAQAAHKIGMDYDNAEKIAKQVFLGCADLLKTNTPKSLRQAVTSPNGTTQAGLTVLMNLDLDTENSKLAELFHETLHASKNRSENIL